MASFGFLKVTCVMLVTCIMLAAPGAQAAVTCGTVLSSLSPCINYLKGGVGAPPPPACCGGIKSLNNAAKTTLDRQTACKCLKTIAGSIAGINYGVAAGLPDKCGVKVPFKISPSTDCSSIKRN